MFELWGLFDDGFPGWFVIYRSDQRWKVEHEASRWPKWQVEIVEAVRG